MSDFSDAKSSPGAMFPIGSIESTWDRTDPLITAEQVIERHLFGLSLVSGAVDAITKKPKVMTPDVVKGFIEDAISTVELETGLTIFPTVFLEKKAHDPQEYQSFGYFQLLNRPVMNVSALDVTLTSGLSMFKVPGDWIETANLHRGQVNLIPLASSLGSGAPSTGGPVVVGWAPIMAALSLNQWTPALWQFKYTAGFPDGRLPKALNQLIGVVAAMDIISVLAATHANANSASLSLDGFSQSTGSAGPQRFTTRMGELATKRAMLTKKLKVWANLVLFSSNV